MSCNYITGNNIYGEAVRESLLKLQQAGSEENAAYILMQRIFPANSTTYIMRNGYCHKDQTISELGIYGAYLRYVACLHMNLFHFSLTSDIHGMLLQEQGQGLGKWPKWLSDAYKSIFV